MYVGRMLMDMMANGVDVLGNSMSAASTAVAGARDQVGQMQEVPSGWMGWA